MKRLPRQRGSVALIATMVAPSLLAAYFFHSAWWLIVWPGVVVILMLIAAVIPHRRKINPQQWTNELEKHLLGTERPYDWNDATSVTLADERMERLRARLIPDFDLPDTPEKREEFSEMIKALRRGEIP